MVLQPEGNRSASTEASFAHVRPLKSWCCPLVLRQILNSTDTMVAAQCERVPAVAAGASLQVLRPLCSPREGRSAVQSVMALRVLCLGPLGWGSWSAMASGLTPTASCSCVTPQLTARTFTLDPALGRVSRTKRLSDSACGTPLPLNRGRQPTEAPAAGSGAITASAEGRRASPFASAVPLASRWLLPRLTLAPEELRLKDRRFCRHQVGLRHPTINPFSRLLC